MPARRSTRQGRIRPTRVARKRGTVRLKAQRHPARPSAIKRLIRTVRSVRVRLRRRPDASRSKPATVLGRPPSRSVVNAPAPAAVTHQPSAVRPPPAAYGRAEDHFAIPSGYGETKLTLLVRDPWWLYAYWEVRGEREHEVRQQIPDGERQTAVTILRVYEAAGGDPVQPWCDITLKDWADNWYVQVGAPNRSWVAELGLLTAAGRFYPLVRSNIVRTPRYGPSEVIDEEWMCPDDDYWKLFGVAGGFGLGRSSLEVRERFAQQPLEFWSSGSGRSGAASAGPRQPDVARGPTRRVRTSAFRKPSPPASRASVRSP